MRPMSQLLLALALFPACTGGEQATETDIEVDDTDTDSDTGEPDEWMPDENTLIHFNPECAGGISTVVPSDIELGFLGAVRLTPPVYPYSVVALRAAIVDNLDEGCDASIEQTFEVMTSTSTTPPGEWIPEQTVVAPAEDVGENDGGRIVDVYLNEALLLEEGEHLFVAMRVSGTPTALTCFAWCSDANAEADRNYWSNDTELDYPWPTMSSFGLNGWFVMLALGEPAGVQP